MKPYLNNKILWNGGGAIVSVKMFGRKIGMTQIFNKEGFALPVTAISVGPCFITQIKTKKKNGYNAIQVGYFKCNSKNLSKAQLGLFKKYNLPPLLYLQEYKVASTNDYVIGQLITVDEFHIGQFVNITGKSIGKGFSGNQTRHKFKRGPMTHGSKNHRAPGSIGPGTTPGRVFPGKLMAGQLGSRQVSISNLEILGRDINKNVLILKGSIPGKSGNLLSLVKSEKS